MHIALKRGEMMVSHKGFRTLLWYLIYVHPSCFTKIKEEENYQNKLNFLKRSMDSLHKIDIIRQNEYTNIFLNCIHCIIVQYFNTNGIIVNILAKEKEHINSIINDNDNVINNLYTSPHTTSILQSRKRSLSSCKEIEPERNRMMLLPQQEESIQTLSEELSDGSIQNQHSSTLESLYFTLSSSSTSSSEAESTFKSTQSKSISLPSFTTFLPTRTNSRNSKCSGERMKSLRRISSPKWSCIM